MSTKHYNYWQSVWQRFCKHRLGLFAFYVVALFCVLGIYAPFLASSKPLFVEYDQTLYFPLFRYLFYSGFYTKRLDIFFNLLMFTLPAILLATYFLKNQMRKITVSALLFLQIVAFLYFAFVTPHDPSSDSDLNQSRHEALKQQTGPDWNFDLKYMTPYAKLNMLLRYQQREKQHRILLKYSEPYFAASHQKTIPSLWQMDHDYEDQQITQQQDLIAKYPSDSQVYQSAQAELKYLTDKRSWLEQESAKLHFEIMPLLSPYHWEDDAGGQQAWNQYVPWWELTRINRKDLLSALLFGTRISLTVGIISVALAMLIGVPIGALAGFYGSTFDIVVSRLLEIWESMPTFFMLLLAVGILQSKSIFLVITIIGLFGWTGFSRYTRGEFFKQRNLPYVEACRALGFRDGYIMFKHILPNGIPPVLTLLPFAVMGAITSEAGLSFLGLGEEGSCSWGVLMDEGRTAFPQESYLLWPPAILLTVLLVAIAVVGDSLRDTLDPKLHK